MTVQEQIIGKVAQAKAIKQAMSYAMPTEVFKTMNGYVEALLEEAINLNAEEGGDNFYDNLKVVDDAIMTEIVARY